MNITPYNFARQAINWLLPRLCINYKCELTKNESIVCASCYESLPFQSHNCQQCGQSYSSNTDHCGRCLSKPPSFDQCFCPFEYKSSIKELICQIKYRERPELAKSAAILLANELRQQEMNLPNALIAVPMHPKRLNERGFNHSQLIAKHLSKELGIPLLSNTLIKSKHTQTQASQSLKQRQKNVLGSFKVKKNLMPEHLAIIDDVLTTGATAEEIAKILKKNGVDYIQVWGIAHTL